MARQWSRCVCGFCGCGGEANFGEELFVPTDGFLWLVKVMNHKL